jgi:CubicO group peptidase (beta-lactamase class C family)
VVLCQGYGESNREHAIPNTPDTVFRIASLSKQFTAIAIMQLQEQGLLSLHESVTSYLPAFPHNKITLHHYQSVIPNRATGYLIKPDGTVEHASFIDMTFPHGAGALTSTVKDLFIWSQALYSHILISEESLGAMLTPYATDRACNVSYGYGLCIDSAIYHIGEIEGFRAALGYYPDSDLTVIVLSNQETTDIAALYSTLGAIVIRDAPSPVA